MSRSPGLFSLQRPIDLVHKLEHDYARMAQEPLNPYPAFDFFISGWHMLEWALPGEANKWQRARLARRTPLLQICSELANGSKHLQLRKEQQQSVLDTVARAGATYGEAQYGTSRYGTPAGLEIRLRPHQAKALYGQVDAPDFIDAPDLAGRLLAFWRAYLAPTLAPQHTP
jgi:hypothetical protein